MTTTLPGHVHAWALVAVLAGAAAVLARSRARRSVGERGLWNRLAVAGALSAASSGVTALLAVSGEDGVLLAVPGAVGMAIAYPFVYGGLVAWNRTGGRLADPHESLNGLSAVLAVTAATELLLPSPAPGAAWWELHVTAFLIAASFVLVGTAASVNLIAEIGRDPRSWLLGVAFLPPGAGAVLDASVPDRPTWWWVVVPAVSAVAVGVAAVLPPRVLVPQPTDPVASTIGGYAVIVVSAGLLVVGSLADASAVVTWAAGVAVCGAGTRLLINTRDLAQLETVREEARTDELTGLGNRRAVLARLAEPESAGRAQVVALVDLDRFKEVNDGLGHDAGDQLLRAVADRLATVVGPGELLGRLGGDEFALVGLVRAGGTAGGRAAEIGQAVLARLADPFDLDGFRVHVRASVGLAVASAEDPATAPGRLLRQADAAMYQAKRSQSGLAIHDAALDADTVDRLAVAEQLRAALGTDQVVLHYQPQVSVASGRTAGVEALVRWAHPTRGLVPPGEFLGVAEAHGLMPALTDVVLGRAVAQAARWRAAGVHLRMSVNVPASALLDVGLPGRVEDLLATHGVPPAALVLEVTESTLISDSERSIAVLEAVAARGVGVSLDDFGTGWSSLTYLRTLPATELKLDRSFTAELLGDARVAAIVASTVGLAHDLGLRVVAEGVEDAATLDRLVAVGCDESQGYLHSPALPPAELLSWVLAGDRAPQRPVTGVSRR